MNRRKFFGFISSMSIASAFTIDQSMAGKTKEKAKLLVTPSETEGPFYPIKIQKDQDFDLTRIVGHEKSALGKVIKIHGQVVDELGGIIEDATVDLWQANAAGKYWHPRDPNPALIDEHFQGWAIVQSGKQGQFRFRTIKPGAYPVAKNWSRPPHIHFKISKPGYQQLTTQMYFPKEELNQVDRLLQRKSVIEQQAMIAKQDEADENTFFYKIVLRKSVV